jgi:hypothetical protein
MLEMSSTGPLATLLRPTWKSKVHCDMYSYSTKYVPPCPAAMVLKIGAPDLLRQPQSLQPHMISMLHIRAAKSRRNNICVQMTVKPRYIRCVTNKAIHPKSCRKTIPLCTSVN